MPSEKKGIEYLKVKLHYWALIQHTMDTKTAKITGCIAPYFTGSVQAQ